MKQTLLMAVDLGTSFIKAGIYTTDSRCIAEAMEPVKDYRPSPGVFIQKGEELFASVINCIKNVSAQLESRAADIEAIAFTGQMAGFMGVTEDWEDVTTWSCSLDSRYMPYANRLMEQLRDPFLELSGTSYPQMAPKIQWYSSEFPSEAKRVAKYLMISGYVIGRLGKVDIEEAAIDRSYITWTGLADVRRDSWSDYLCDAVGVDQRYLPRIVNSNYICGYLCKEMAELTGLKSGIPLVSGAGDKMAGALGGAAVDTGDMIFEASSYGEISCSVDSYRADMQEHRLDILCSAVPGAFYATHFAAGSGITLDWFINNFARERGESLGDAFSRMEEKIAKLEPGCAGLMGLGLLGGSAMPLDGALRGMWMGFDWSHQPEHFYRALLESFTYDFALAIERMDALYPEYNLSDVTIIGGGAKSPVWTQMSADVTGKTYHTLSRKDISMWGAAMLAGNAIGVFQDLKQTAKQYAKREKAYAPNPQMQERYHKYKELYRQYLVELSGFFSRIQALEA